MGFGIKCKISQVSLLNRLRAVTIPQRFTGGYFGVRRADFFTPKFEDYVKQCSGFVDLTAGTGQFSYKLACDGLRVGVNDRCLYAATLLSCLFNREWERFDMKHWVDCLDPSNVVMRKGWLYDHHRFLKSKKKRIFSDEVAQYLDSICVEFSHNLVRYGVGKVLVKFSHRGHGFCSVDAKGRLFESYTVEEVYWLLLSEIQRMMLFARRLKGKDTKATYLDAIDVFDSFDVNGCFVYVDPAWPWAGRFGGSNPYKFFTDTISSVIAQEEIVIPSWE